MSDHTTTAAAIHEHASAPTTGETPEIPFDRAELRQFGADDVEAGRNICKMLSIFFAYTVMVMALSTYITWRWVMGG